MDDNNNSKQNIDISHNLFSVMNMIAIPEYVMFGSFRCQSQSVEMNRSGVRMANIMFGENKKLYHIDLPFVEMDFINYREGEHNYYYLTIKPNSNFIHVIRSSIDSNIDIKFGINLLDEKENQIIIAIKKWSNDRSDYGDLWSKRLAQTIVEGFFDKIQNFNIANNISIRGTKRLVNDEIALNESISDSNSVKELTDELNKLRHELNQLKRKQSDTNNRAQYLAGKKLRPEVYDIIYGEIRPYEIYAEAILIYKIENFSQLLDYAISPSVVVRNVSWNIMALPHVSGDVSVKTLGFFLQCKGDPTSGEWFCDLSAELKIVAQTDGREGFSKTIQHRFNSEQNDWGFKNFLGWDQIVNPENGLIKDDAVILEVWFLI